MRGKTQSHFAIVMLVLGSSAALAAEPSGCDQFKWPVDRERAALTAADRPDLRSGTELPALPTTAVVLALRNPADAALPAPPERSPKQGTWAGFLRVRQIPKAGVYTVALSQPGWVDLVQDGDPLKPTGFSGVTDCEGIRKIVKYQLAAGPLLLQISGSTSEAVAVAVLPSD